MTIATLLFALIAVPMNPDSGGERRPIMLDFTASWCGPCRQMRPLVEQLIDQGFPIKPVDVDKSPELAAKYKISGIPAFTVIDPDTGRMLGRLEGSRPAADLASLYNEAKAKYESRNPPQDRPDSARTQDARERDPTQEAPEKGSLEPNPKPWETVVRIKVHGNGSIGFGSGTIISSSPDETIILTCAHIFKMDSRKQATPSKFPLRITVDLFDGNLVGPKKNQVHYTNETFEGKAIDYDFVHDVGLIRIRPGKRLPYAKVVPPHWTPKSNMRVITVGCSQGQDATAWSTLIDNPNFRGIKDGYEAIECKVAPIQGRSGGGLFTTDGYVAGVCDFAVAGGHDQGLYAHPRSIYGLLNRNNMVALYDPSRVRAGTAIAANSTRGQDVAEIRGQSPDANDPGGVTLPPPEMVGVKPPVLASRENLPVRPNRMSWHPSVEAKPVKIELDPSADTDRFDDGTPQPRVELQPQIVETTPVESATRPGRPSGGKWKRSTTPLPAFASVQAN